MKTRASALYRRTESYRNGRNGALGATVAVVFALLPLGVMLWALPITGLGIA